MRPTTPRWDSRGSSARRPGPGTGPRAGDTGLVPRQHLGRPIHGTGLVALRPALQDSEDRVGGLLRSRIRRLDFVNEWLSVDGLLQDDVNRLGLDVLADLLRRPATGSETP